MIGKTLGHYQITGQIGKGGMGEVYHAKDQILGRDVAIKVLPEEFAKDTDRVARFQREAKLLASLNHPNIAAIHGLEESGGTNFLVLELVEGETLADRIKTGPIPVEESLNLALQIAEALEAAHEKGVIHRDLKPANIKVTPEGKAKVLDFGLAKAFAGEQSDLNLSTSPTLTRSPTLSNMATQQGVILGTAAYMSPEQARGKSVDKRADIWAFGCVLCEMLTGCAVFHGEDVSEILASVIKGDVKLELLPPETPPRLRELLGRCLQKDLKKRYQDMGDMRYEIEQVQAHRAVSEPVTDADRKSKLRMLLIATGIIMVAILAGLVGWSLKPLSLRKPGSVARFFYELSHDQKFGVTYERALAISPDGRQFVYSMPDGLYLRSLDELDARPILGTGSNPQKPFFSFDGKWIGYWSGEDNHLKKILVTGGIPVSLTDAVCAGSYRWGSDDTIVFGMIGKGIVQISANGGSAEQIIKEKENEIIISPQILPGGNAVLFTRVVPRPFKVMLQLLKSGERKELFQGDTAEYLSTGHIVYAIGNSLHAVPFDLDKLKVTGESINIVEGVLRGAAPQYATSEAGTLIYLPGSTVAALQRTLGWVDRNGKEQLLSAAPDSYGSPQISPDGTKVALTIGSFGNGDVNIWDLIRNSMTRLTFDTGNAPLWTLDGKRIAYGSFRESFHKVYWKAADNTGKIDPLGSVSSGYIFPSSWSDNGENLILTEYNVSASGRYSIGLLSMNGDRQHRSLPQQKYNLSQPRISPDGHWMAYTSDESGQSQIYVVPFPAADSGGRWQVSREGGDSALWARDGGELFYRNGDAVMAAPVRTNPSFSFETPKPLFHGIYVSSNVTLGSFDLNPWDISLDGKRFLMMKESASGAGGEGPRRIYIVLNWLEELRQRVRPK
jgi:eukaryotic-like serine/threonine-protein kinase